MSMHFKLSKAVTMAYYAFGSGNPFGSEILEEDFDYNLGEPFGNYVFVVVNGFVYIFTPHAPFCSLP